ncbi:MAG: glycosyltransferase family 1 protein, partial [Planctomycetota bacterium]|nr:glycosyltransferase family 1 protein [Planctomycetota bacterium]
VIPEETGYLLPVEEITGLADAICELAESAALRERLGMNGRERFTETFRHQTMTAQIREVYQRVLANR